MHQGNIIENRNMRKPIATRMEVYTSFKPAYFDRSPAAQMSMNAEKNIGYLYLDCNIFFIFTTSFVHICAMCSSVMSRGMPADNALM